MGQGVPEDHPLIPKLAKYDTLPSFDKNSASVLNPSWTENKDSMEGNRVQGMMTDTHHISSSARRTELPH